MTTNLYIEIETYIKSLMVARLYTRFLNVCGNCCKQIGLHRQNNLRLSGSSRFIVNNVKSKNSKSSRMAGSGKPINDQVFDYFLVLDFEATCDDKSPPVPQEIIEFPVLKVSGKTFEVEATFHEYVEPRINKELTPFCTELTGIIQEMVDGKPHLEEVLGKFDRWMVEEGILEKTFVFVTCGDWDLKKMLPPQCKYFSVQPAEYFSKWINIKKPFSAVMKDYPDGMMMMLKKLGIQHEGRHHSGIDDCKNIAKILKGLADKGYVFKATGSL